MGDELFRSSIRQSPPDITSDCEVKPDFGPQGGRDIRWQLPPSPLSPARQTLSVENSQPILYKTQTD